MQQRLPASWVTHVCWILCLAFLLVVAEVFAGQLGFLFPSACLLAFFLTVSHTWWIGMIAGAILLAVTEIVFARNGSLLPLVVLVVAGAQAWKRTGDCATVLTQAFPGALLGIAYAAGVLALANLTFSPLRLAMAPGSMAIEIARAGLLAAIALPLLVGAVDWIADRLDLRQYHRRAPTGEASR